MGAVKQAWAQEMEELLEDSDIDSGWDTYFQSKQHQMNVLTDTAFYNLLEHDDKAGCLELLSQVLVLQEELFQAPVIERRTFNGS